ncbi:GAF domain-containing protein, partial [Streptomyces hyaluromycini]
MVSEGAAVRGTRTDRAEIALETLTGDPGAPDRLRRVLEQALVFAGAAFAGVYTPGDDGTMLRLAESAGLPRTLYGLRDAYPAIGRSPAAEAYGSGRSVWLAPDELADCPEARRTPSQEFWLAALPLPGGAGLLVAVSERDDGFGPEDRACLGLVADAIALPAPLPSATDTGELPADAFSLAMDTGRIAVGDGILDLFRMGRDEFDGKVETLLGRTVPEDVPALMSVVEADHMSIGDRELEFRILQPSGPPKWLRLRGRLVPGGEGRPARLAGTVADASTFRSDVTDVARVQQLAAALATAGTVKDVSQAVVTALRAPLKADRIALAELENERLVVVILDPPEAESWPELWRSEWRTEWPDAPVRSMPTLATALREGRAQIWPAAAALEPALAEVGPGGLAILPLPAGGRMAGACLIGWDSPHDFGPDERALLTASAGLAGEALMRAHSFDAEHELVGMLQRALLPPGRPGSRRGSR